MKMIIVGSGKVGYAIAQQMSTEKHDIILVDENTAALHRAEATLDAMVMEGNGASIRVLLDAGVRDADLVIAVTGVDETNLVCCLIAKRLGAKHTIARVRNPEYRAEANMLKQEIGLDMVINPDLAAALEISRILSFPAAFSVEPFVHGRIDMIGFQVLEGDTLCGKSLRELTGQRPAEVLLCAAVHDGQYLIPNGDFTPQAGDSLYMIGSKAELQKMLRHIGRQWQKVKTVSAIGGSRIAEYLSWELKKTGTALRIVELNHDKCLRLAAKLPHAMVVCGDGVDNDFLQQENIFGADAVVSLTNRDEENLLMALHAKRSGVSKVIAKMTRPNYMELVKEMGIESIISPKDIIASQITRYVRAFANSAGSGMESLYRLFGGEVEAVEFVVDAQSRALHIPLKDLPTKKGILLAAIARDTEIIIPSGMTTLQEKDRVVIVAKQQELRALEDILV